MIADNNSLRLSSFETDYMSKKKAQILMLL